MKWKEILEIKSGKNQKNVIDANGQYPIYGSGGIIGYAKEYLCPAGTTIIGRKGTINSPIYVNGPFWNVDTAFGLIPGQQLVSKYLYYFCCYFNFKALDKSTTIPSLAKRDLENIEMPVPPLDEQARLVARIEELFSELDKAVDTLKTTKKQLAVYRQAVLKDEFSKVFQYASLGNIATSRLGKMLDKQKNTGTPKKYLRNVNVRWFSFDLADLQEMKIEETEFEKYTIKKDDLVICEGGEPGRCAVWEKNETIFFQKALHRVRFTIESEPRLYMYYLWFVAKTGVLSEFYTGTGIKHLTGQSLEKVLVPNIDIKAQQKLLTSIELRLSVCDSIEKTVDTTLAQADAMRQSILKQAFEGKI